jgi:prepilin-type N-terminal cleavage/methylation domain-containing protein
MFKNFHKNKYNSGPASTQGGVTLIELMVVIVIFVIMSGVVLFNYSQFRSSTSIQNLADDIALSIRKAQSYAIGVRGSSGAFNFGYGVHFTTADSTSENAGSNKSFVLFANIDNDNKYDSSSQCGNPTSGNECLEVLNITSADEISEISVRVNGEKNVRDTLDIFFKRPNPEPTFCARNGPSDACIFSNDISSIEIKISNDSDLGVYKTITIWNNGQISVL